MRSSPHRKLRSILAAGAAIMLVGAGFSTSATAAPEPQATGEALFELNASDLDDGLITSDLPIGGFVIRADGSGNYEVDGNNKTGDNGATFTKRLKTGGAGSATNRSVYFEAPAAGILSIYALSSSGSADRHLSLHPADEVSEASEISRVDAFGDPGAVIPRETIEIADPGAYILRSPSSGVNIYYLAFSTEAEVERPAWDTVAAPVITDVSVNPANPGELLISYDGELGTSGADLATAVVYSADDSVVAEGVNAGTSSDGVITVTPPQSGDFRIEVSLSRSGEDDVLTSQAWDFSGFELPLEDPEIISARTVAVTGGVSTVKVQWSEVPEAISYSVSYRQVGETDFTTAASDLTELEYLIENLTPGTEIEIQITAHRGGQTSAVISDVVSVDAEVQRWQTAHAGVGSGGEVIDNEDGTITFDAINNSGKIADSEDGFWYHFTEIDPATENFTLSATFHVDDAEGKDNQSGFGIIAVDDFVPNTASARYFNSAGVMAAKYVGVVDGDNLTRYGTPGAKFVTGYTGSPDQSSPDRDMTASEPFDWFYKDGYEFNNNANPPRIATGETYEFTLRKSNTGFHAITTLDGVEHEVIHYDPDLLLAQNQESYYVGIFTARKMKVTVSDINFTTIHPDADDEALERPINYIDLQVTANVTRTTAHSELTVPVVANAHGEAAIYQDGIAVGNPVQLQPREPGNITVQLESGSNEFELRFTPDARDAQLQLGEYEDLTSYDPVVQNLVITSHKYGEPGEALYVSPTGTAEGSGTKANPLDLHTAVAYVQPGQQIVLLEGTYKPERAIVIDRGNSGTADAPIQMLSEPGTRAVLDLSESVSGGIMLRGDYWHLYNLEITQSRGYQKPLHISGHHNVIERIESHHNGDTGVQISGSSDEPFEMWPSHNLVVSSIAHNNADPLANDADGFAAKLTVGDGNVFRYNIAHNNIDDGWDLYAKSTTGQIGAVRVEHSVAYNNGWLEADTEYATLGEGNGFKLGGESMPGAHVLYNSISYNNAAKGVTSNSGPDVVVEDVTIYHNGHVVPSHGRMNLQLTTSAAQTDYVATGVLSYEGQQGEDIVLKGQADEITTDPSNYLNGLGVGDQPDVADDWFVSLDMGLRPEIAADGSIQMHGLLELTDLAPADTGARFAANPNPTQVQVLPEVTEPDDGVDGDTDPGDGDTDPGDDDTDPGEGDTDPGDSDGSADPDETDDSDETDPGHAEGSDETDTGALPGTGFGATLLLLGGALFLIMGGMVARRYRAVSQQSEI